MITGTFLIVAAGLSIILYYDDRRNKKLIQQFVEANMCKCDKCNYKNCDC